MCVKTLIHKQTVNDTTIIKAQIKDATNTSQNEKRIKQACEITWKTTYDSVLAKLSKYSVESPSCHNGFSLDLDDHKNKMESPPIFSVRV